MNNYAEMSDFEINNLVYNKVKNLGYILKFTGNDNIEWHKDGDVIKTGKVEYSRNGLHDYCNNIADAWPIIFENRITVNPYDNPPEGWFSTYDTSFFIDDENPLRAAMIVYLMMKDSEQ